MEWVLGNIKFNELRTYDDLGFTIADIQIGFPAPITKLEKIPYSNTYLDFSSTSGMLEYSTRTITIVFKLDKYISDTSNLNAVYFNLINSLSSVDFKKLEIDFLEGYFLARIESCSNFDLMQEDRLIEVVFLCMPFRYIENSVGSEAWDTFVFATDVLQETEYIVNKYKNITLHNQSVALETVTIIADSEFKIVYNNVEYSIKNGINKEVFKLNVGINNLNVQGTGIIKFEFYKEVI